VVISSRIKGDSKFGAVGGVVSKYISRSAGINNSKVSFINSPLIIFSQSGQFKVITVLSVYVQLQDHTLDHSISQDNVYSLVSSARTSIL
jgi:hypothetical protein